MSSFQIILLILLEIKIYENKNSCPTVLSHLCESLDLAFGTCIA
jgi:hypothetical protein